MQVEDQGLVTIAANGNSSAGVPNIIVGEKATTTNNAMREMSTADTYVKGVFINNMGLHRRNTRGMNMTNSKAAGAST